MQEFLNLLSVACPWCGRQGLSFLGLIGAFCVNSSLRVAGPRNSVMAAERAGRASGVCSAKF